MYVSGTKLPIAIFTSPFPSVVYVLAPFKSTVISSPLKASPFSPLRAITRSLLTLYVAVTSAAVISVDNFEMVIVASPFTTPAYLSRLGKENISFF